MCCGLNWSLAALLAELTRPRWLFFAMFAFLSSQGRFMSTFLSERGLTNAQARGTITGLNASHGRGHVYRATLEGISLEQTIATNRAAEASGMEVDHYVAIGGGSNSDLWCQILADASGRKVARSATVEASALGAAMAAARAANWFGSVDEASAAMAGQLTDVFNPEKSASARYSELLKIYADLWPTMAAWNARLVDFLDEEKTR